MTHRSNPVGRFARPIRLLVGQLLLLGLSLAGVELALRYLGFVDTNRIELSLVRFHPILGWEKVPGAVGWRRAYEYSVYQRINANGLADDETPYTKPPGEHRVLVLGDSFAEGYTVAASETFARITGQELRSRSASVRVINGGTGGYATDQATLFYEMEGRHYAPDIVVLAFYDNDVLDNIADSLNGKAKPRFAIENQTLFLTNVPLPPPTPRAPADGGPTGWSGPIAVIARPIQSLSLYLFALQLLGPRVTEVDAFLVRTGVRDRPVGMSSHRTVPIGLRVFDRSEPEPVPQAWRLTRALIARLRDSVMTDGGRLLVVLVPNKTQIQPDAWEATKRAYDGVSEETWDIDQVAHRLGEVTTDLGIDYLDLTPSMREAAREKRLYFAIDGHWNAAGHDVAGRLIADDVARRFGPSVGLR
ncbi:MAG: hypothetical protein EPO26_11485 [Chloroflexota bacterium]|nr:MAG: hypothetical protein EPO26_11485 [Chloroflexota bacterium]